MRYLPESGLGKGILNLINEIEDSMRFFSRGQTLT
jgi:hypothetical protein